MAEFKKGQKVQVSYAAKYAHRGASGCHYLDVEIGRFDAPPNATIEVIEEPFEEGAIYEFEGCEGVRYRMAYLPEGNRNRPWAYISGLGGLYFGDRFNEIETLIGKLAPLAQ